MNDPAFESFIEYRDVNYGGCGIYALAVARYLMNQGFDKLQLLICHRWKDDLHEIKNSNNIIGKVPNHIVIIAGEYCIDSNRGVVDLSDYIDLTEENGKQCAIIDFIESDLVTAINDKDSWNPMFERSTYLPQFESRFKISLNDIKL